MLSISWIRDWNKWELYSSDKHEYDVTSVLFFFSCWYKGGVRVHGEEEQPFHDWDTRRRYFFSSSGSHWTLTILYILDRKYIVLGFWMSKA